MSVLRTAVSFVLGRPAWQLKISGAVLASGMLYAYAQHVKTSLRNEGAQIVRDSIETHHVAVLAKVQEAAAAAVDAKAPVLKQTLRRTDTLWRTVPETLRTQADTVRVLQSLPEIRRASLADVAACRDYEVSCAEYRRSTDSLVLGLRGQIARRPPSSNRHWGLGVTAGYGAFWAPDSTHRNPVQLRPGLIVGLTYRW